MNKCHEKVTVPETETIFDGNDIVREQVNTL